MPCRRRAVLGGDFRRPGIGHIPWCVSRFCPTSTPTSRRSSARRWRWRPTTDRWRRCPTM